MRKKQNNRWNHGDCQFIKIHDQINWEIFPSMYPVNMIEIPQSSTNFLKCLIIAIPSSYEHHSSINTATLMHRKKTIKEKKWNEYIRIISTLAVYISTLVEIHDASAWFWWRLFDNVCDSVASFISAHTSLNFPWEIEQQTLKLIIIYMLKLFIFDDDRPSPKKQQLHRNRLNRIRWMEEYRNRIIFLGCFAHANTFEE